MLKILLAQTEKLLVKIQCSVLYAEEMVLKRVLQIKKAKTRIFLQNPVSKCRSVQFTLEHSTISSFRLAGLPRISWKTPASPAWEANMKPKGIKNTPADQINVRFPRALTLPDHPPPTLLCPVISRKNYYAKRNGSHYKKDCEHVESS